jgi:hypothetical protein
MEQILKMDVSVPYKRVIDGCNAILQGRRWDTNH